MDELVEQELAQYALNSPDYIEAIFAAQPYFMTNDAAGYTQMLKRKKDTSTKKVYETCEHCSSDDLVYINSEAAIVCTQCATNQKFGGNTSDVMLANARFTGTNYIDSPHFYERKSHFIHIINELTGRCKTRIPSHVYEVVQAGEMTLNGARASLRKAKLSAYICSVARILEELSPHTCVSLSYGNMQALISDFKRVSWAWDRVQPKIAPKRRSFISYPFVLKKLCERQGLEFLCRDIKKVKSAQASLLLEKYWKAIEEKLEWNTSCQPIKDDFKTKFYYAPLNKQRLLRPLGEWK